MRIAFNQDKSLVLFVHEDAYEYKFLTSFPAFTREGMYFCCPAKVQVVHNIVERLKKTKRKLKIDKDVYDFLQAPFALKQIPESFKFYTTPMDYQTIALRYLYTVGSGGLLLDPGMGKSKVVLDYIALMGFKKVIIVCPKALLFVWEDEIAVHRPDLAYYTVQTTDWEAEKEGILGTQVVIVNYNKAVAFEPQLSAAGFEFIHLDEFLIKDPKTDRTKTLTKLGKSCTYRCGGSGTLINNSLLDLFCPVRFLEPSLVGWNYTHLKDKYTVKNLKDPRQIVAYKGVDEARSILESCSIVMSKERWLKLPKKRFHDISVSLTDEQRDAYYGLQKNYIAKIGEGFVEIDNPLVMLSKLYQISNGFVYIPQEESEAANEVEELLAAEPKSKRKVKRTTHFFENSAKIIALERLLTEKLQGKRPIIWFNMEAEYVLIQAMLERLGHSYLTIKGGEKNIGAKVRKFNTDPSVRWLICQAKSVNYGITVLGTSEEKLEADGIEAWPGIAPEVHTEVFYSMNFSLEVYLQQQDRIHRIGQKHECDYYRIFASTPVERRIRDAIGDKMSIRHDMLVDIAEKIKGEELPEELK